MTARATARRPAHGERSRAGVVDIGLGARERHAVVGGHDDDRVLELPPPLERLQDRAHVVVEALDLEVIVEDIVAHLGSSGR